MSVNFLQNRLIFGLYFSALTIFSFFIFSNWTLMLAVWIILILLFWNQASKLPQPEGQFFWWTAYLYPLLASWLKWSIINQIISHSWFWLNRIEHFIWSASMVIIFIPLYSAVYKQKYWLSLIFMLGFVCLWGCFVEFFEFGLRFYIVGDQKLYYNDTIFDLATNLGGGLFAWVSIKIFVKRFKFMFNKQASSLTSQALPDK
jgi:hypothetical protein